MALTTPAQVITPNARAFSFTYKLDGSLRVDFRNICIMASIALPAISGSFGFRVWGSGGVYEYGSLDRTTQPQASYTVSLRQLRNSQNGLQLKSPGPLVGFAYLVAMLGVGALSSSHRVLCYPH